MTTLSLWMEGKRVAISASGWSSEVFFVWGDLSHKLLNHCSQVTCLALSPSEDRILSGGSDMGIKVFKTLCESLAWRCSVGMFGKMLSVLHGMEEEGSVCDTDVMLRGNGS